VLTNNPYAASLRYLRRHRGFGGKEEIPHTPASLARFARAAKHGRAFRTCKGDRRIAAFSALEDVRQGDFTKWQIVYEPLRGEVSFRRAGEEGFTTAKVEDKDCNAPVEVMDLFGTLIKGERRFVPYTLELNRKLIQKSFKALGARFPPPVLEMLARYPDALRCTHGVKPGADAPDAARDRPVLAALEAYRKGMVARDSRALVALVHPRYADDVGTPDPADDLDRAAVVKALRERLSKIGAVRYRIEQPSVTWDAPGRVHVDATIEARYQLKKGGKWISHTDRNRFVLARHKGRWLFLRGM
jgi:hypothetical protein